MGGAEINEVKTGEFFSMSMEMSEGTCFAWSMKQLGAMKLIEDEYHHTKSRHAREVSVVIQRASIRERSPKQILHPVKDRRCKAVQLQSWETAAALPKDEVYGYIYVALFVELPRGMGVQRVLVCLKAAAVECGEIGSIADSNCLLLDGSCRVLDVMFTAMNPSATTAASRVTLLSM
ncbi:hypothetical protein AKJ16_DCAP14674 [Drosera capensis]